MGIIKKVSISYVGTMVCLKRKNFVVSKVFSSTIDVVGDFSLPLNWNSQLEYMNPFRYDDNFYATDHHTYQMKTK